MTHRAVVICIVAMLVAGLLCPAQAKLWSPDTRFQVSAAKANGKAEAYVCLGDSVTFTVDGACGTDADTDTYWDPFYDKEDVTCTWDFGDGSSLQTGCSVTYTYTTAGTYTASVVCADEAKAIGQNDTGSRDDPNTDEPDEPGGTPPPPITCVVHVVRVVSVDWVSGGAVINPGTNPPPDTNICGAARTVEGTPGEVIVQAITQPSVPQDKLPSCFQWIGGEAVEGNALQRKVSTATCAKHTLTAKCNTSSASMIVYIVGAEPTGYKPENGLSGTGFADNDGGYTSTGIYDPDPYTGKFRSHCEIQFKILPENTLVQDGANGIFSTSDIKWDVTRQRRTKTWILSPDGWTVDMNTDWDNDDAEDTDEDNDPWGSGNGHLYGNDWPEQKTDLSNTNIAKLVVKANMREWVRVGIGSSASSHDTRCSDYRYWRVFRSVRWDSIWENDPDYENEIPLGNVFWGDEPFSFMAINTTTLPNCPRGYAYSQTLSCSGTDDPPVSWSIDSGSLPPGMSLSTGGVISGTPTATGVYEFAVEAEDAFPMNDIQWLSIEVVEPLQITTDSLPGGIVSTSYSQNLACAGGTAPITWSVSSGSLPPGLSLSSSGAISGTPTTAGNYNFAVQAQCSSTPSSSDTQNLAINVADN